MKPRDVSFKGLRSVFMIAALFSLPATLAAAQLVTGVDGFPVTIPDADATPPTITVIDLSHDNAIVGTNLGTRPRSQGCPVGKRDKSTRNDAIFQRGKPIYYAQSRAPFKFRAIAQDDTGLENMRLAGHVDADETSAKRFNVRDHDGESNSVDFTDTYGFVSRKHAHGDIEMRFVSARPRFAPYDLADGSGDLAFDTLTLNFTLDDLGSEDHFYIEARDYSGNSAQLAVYVKDLPCGITFAIDRKPAERLKKVQPIEISPRLRKQD